MLVTHDEFTENFLVRENSITIFICDNTSDYNGIIKSLMNISNCIVKQNIISNEDVRNTWEDVIKKQQSCVYMLKQSLSRSAFEIGGWTNSYVPLFIASRILMLKDGDLFVFKDRFAESFPAKIRFKE